MSAGEAVGWGFLAIGVFLLGIAIERRMALRRCAGPAAIARGEEGVRQRQQQQRHALAMERAEGFCVAAGIRPLDLSVERARDAIVEAYEAAMRDAGLTKYQREQIHDRATQAQHRADRERSGRR